METTVTTEPGRAIILDFRPRPGSGGVHELVRIVRGFEGCATMRANLRVRFNYGQSTPGSRNVTVP